MGFTVHRNASAVRGPADARARDFGRLIRLDRDPAFWRWVLADPEVSKGLLGADPEQVIQLLAQPHVKPLASENGGYVFIQMDQRGRAFELHSLFRPEGWGRETLLSGKQAARQMFSSGAKLLMTHEVEGQWRTRPPRSFGFAPAGEPEDGRRTWVLTQLAWNASPAGRR